jgi:hypothetical protein
MNDEQNFEDLRKLLALKKHEQPPPGYFNRLPGKILARIEASEFATQSTWWDWLVARFDARPILACAYGFTISGLLLMGFRLSQALQHDPDAETSTASLGGGWLAATPDAITTQPGPFLQAHIGTPAATFLNFSSSEPVIELNSSRPIGRMFQPVSYSWTP